MEATAVTAYPVDLDKPRLEHPSREGALAELDLVELATSMLLEDGRTLPAGALGVIVGLWANVRAYEVEFSAPFEALITARAEQLRLLSDVIC